ADAMATDDVLPWLSRLQTPATVVVSTDDMPGTADLQDLLAAFRRGLLRDLRRAARDNPRLAIQPVPLTHAMHLESPGTVASLLTTATARATPGSMRRNAGSIAGSLPDGGDLTPQQV